MKILPALLLACAALPALADCALPLPGKGRTVIEYLMQINRGGETSLTAQVHAALFDLVEYSPMGCGDAEPDDSYSRFRIRTVRGIDDYQMMREVIRRRYGGTLAGGLPLPDLILVDGGKGQLAAAVEELIRMPSKGALIALAIGGLKAPISGLVYVLHRGSPLSGLVNVLNGSIRQITTVLQAIAEQKKEAEQA